MLQAERDQPEGARRQRNGARGCQCKTWMKKHFAAEKPPEPPLLPPCHPLQHSPGPKVGGNVRWFSNVQSGAKSARKGQPSVAGWWGCEALAHAWVHFA